MVGFLVFLVLIVFWGFLLAFFMGFFDKDEDEKEIELPKAYACDSCGEELKLSKYNEDDSSFIGVEPCQSCLDLIVSETIEDMKEVMQRKIEKIDITDL